MAAVALIGAAIAARWVFAGPIPRGSASSEENMEPAPEIA
jgi:hypothetical protein